MRTLTGMGCSLMPSASPSPLPASPCLRSLPSSSTVPFSWEQQPGVPKSRQQQQQHKVGKATSLPLPPPPVPCGRSRRSSPTGNSSHHVPGGQVYRKQQQHFSGKEQAHLARLFPAAHSRGQKAANGGDKGPFPLVYGRARHPTTAPFHLPSPPRTTSSSSWGSSKTKSNRGGSASRLSSAFRPLDLYGSCGSSAVTCQSSVVHSTVRVPPRSSSDIDYYAHGRNNRQYVAYAILYGRHG